MDFALYIALIVIAVALINYFVFNKMVTWVELSIQIFGCFLATWLFGFGCSQSKKYDQQIINGKITNKWSEKVHCRHSYECNCYTYDCGTDDHPRTCRHCDTCYEHSYDVDWNVSANTGYKAYSFDIDTIDRQGLKEPPRWTQVVVGEPFSAVASYENYVKANSESLFNRQKEFVEKFRPSIPEYPINVYDYYRINRTMSLGVGVPADFNQKLSVINSELGPAKQCNIAVLFVKNQSPEYFKAMEGAWIGGKKNDIIPIISTDDSGNILWADVLAWSKDEYFKVRLRDDILDLKKLEDYDKILNVIDKNVRENYRRKSMKEFAYLNKTIILTDSEFTWLMVLCLVLCIGASVYVSLNEFNPQ